MSRAAMKRVERFVDEYVQTKGAKAAKFPVIGLNTGVAEREAELTVADLRAVLALAKRADDPSLASDLWANDVAELRRVRAALRTIADGTHPVGAARHVATEALAPPPARGKRPRRGGKAS